MADTDLIAEYLTTLRNSLRWRPDVDDLVCELDDHLRSAALGLQARGLASASAQRAVLIRFGDADLVARSFAQTPSGGTAMPTRLTHNAGTFAYIAALAWLVAAPISFLGGGSEDWEVGYMALALIVFIASACTSVALFGLLSRAGGGRDAVTIVAMLLAVLGTLMLGIATWAWVVWASLLTAAALMTALRLRSARLSTTVGRVLLVAAWPVGIATAIILDLLGVGPIDYYGDAYIAQTIGFAAGSITFAAGLYAQGRWLRRETVVDISDSMATA
jgi:hypothetical protein